MLKTKLLVISLLALPFICANAVTINGNVKSCSYSQQGTDQKIDCTDPNTYHFPPISQTLSSTTPLGVSLGIMGVHDTCTSTSWTYEFSLSPSDSTDTDQVVLEITPTYVYPYNWGIWSESGYKLVKLTPDSNKKYSISYSGVCPGEDIDLTFRVISSNGS